MKLDDFNWIYDLAMNSAMGLLENFKSKNEDWTKGYNYGFLIGQMHVLENMIPHIEDISKDERREIKLELEAVLHGDDIQKIRDKKSFLHLLRSGEEINCDLIIGDVDMPASFVWDENSKITDYGVEKYKAIMKAEYTRLQNGNIEIHCDDDRLGESFCWAAAGYIGLTEFEKIFGKEELD